MTEQDAVPPGYKRTEIGVIPEDWEIKAIGSEIDLLTGYPFPSSKYSYSGIRLLRGSNIKRGITDWSEEITEYWTKITPDLKRYLLYVGDLVIPMDGSLVGRSYAQLSTKDIPSLLLQRVARIRSQKIDIGYLKQFIGSDIFVNYSDSVKTVTAIPHISPEDIRKFTIPIPSDKKEQHAIAAALSDVDGLIGALDALIAKKRDMKQAAMQQLLTGRTRLPGFEGEWEQKRLGDVTEIKNGSTPSTQTTSYWNGHIPWCTPTDITRTAGKYLITTERCITLEGLDNCGASLLPPGTLLLCSRATIGEVKIATTIICTNQGFKSLICKNLISNDFIYYLLLTLKSQLVERAIGSTFLEIGARELSSIVVNLPKFNEQTAIATVLSDMDAEIAALERRCDKVKEIKQGMMQQLLTGKVRLIKQGG